LRLWRRGELRRGVGAPGVLGGGLGRGKGPEGTGVGGGPGAGWWVGGVRGGGADGGGGKGGGGGGEGGGGGCGWLIVVERRSGWGRRGAAVSTGRAGSVCPGVVLGAAGRGDVG